ncbi:TnsA-like heteromeric transposase endonuclease subunit [Microbacterium sp. C5A9]|uniref:TnsA-like heteromeric transposase endonuclease subunit n=1 Tax=Microbacterium sp. C5A9 TaxID=2736663 RepID=UPI001F51834A|nr:TnsA-like heteromeric transposase endonuclease subunit [Microbacterium sp. C5A9]
MDRISWRDAKGVHTTRVSNEHRLNELMPEGRARIAPKYKGQLNYQGHYWFEGVRGMVWHESMAEYSWLMMFDHMRAVRAVSAQPFVLGFADGTTHVPDYLMRTADGSRIVLDVHLQSMTSERDRQAFASTQRVCNELGWEYVLVDQLPDVTAWNLEMVSRYRHPMFKPSSDVRARILRSACNAPRYGALRRALETDKPGEHVPALMHLMWHRELLIDLDAVFTDNSAVTAV